MRRGEHNPNDGNDIQNCSYIEELRLFAIKDKQIWYQINMLDYKSTIFNGYFWCPLTEYLNVENSIKNLRSLRPNLPTCNCEPCEKPDHLTPPTYFQLNEFTFPFQEIVNTYGIPRYREANPGLFAISMFPFKFGVMFGDIGHGGLLLAAGIYLCVKAKELAAQGLENIVQIRYLVLLMGFFAFYCGFIYNDFFSLPWNLFGSCFQNDPHGPTTTKIDGCTYPVGLDPKWYRASNEL